MLSSIVIPSDQNGDSETKNKPFFPRKTYLRSREHHQPSAGSQNSLIFTNENRNTMNLTNGTYLPRISSNSGNENDVPRKTQVDKIKRSVNVEGGGARLLNHKQLSNPTISIPPPIRLSNVPSAAQDNIILGKSSSNVSLDPPRLKPTASSSRILPLTTAVTQKQNDKEVGTKIISNNYRFSILRTLKSKDVNRHSASSSHP